MEAGLPLTFKAKVKIIKYHEGASEPFEVVEHETDLPSTHPLVREALEKGLIKNAVNK
ncbi:hypothetical protein D3C76_334160 [compost metagenome]